MVFNPEERKSPKSGSPIISALQCFCCYYYISSGFSEQAKLDFFSCLLISETSRQQFVEQKVATSFHLFPRCCRSDCWPCNHCRVKKPSDANGISKRNIGWCLWSGPGLYILSEFPSVSLVYSVQQDHLTGYSTLTFLSI